MSGASGRHFLERLMRGPGASPLGLLLDMRLIEVGDGSAVFEARPNASHNNPAGGVHGGYHAALMDSAMGSAVQSLLAEDMAYGTIDLKVSYVRRVTVATGRLICRARVIHDGRQLKTAEARIEDEAGKLYAHATASFLIQV